MSMSLISRFAAMGLLLAVAACKMGPDYTPPTDPIPAGYKESAGWKAAEPSDGTAHGPWWTVYNDATLNSLVSQVTITNQNLKAAEAALRQSQAILDQARSAFWPSISGQGSAQRQGQGARGSSTDLYSANAAASWEIDLWGRIRRSVEANEASAAASAADLSAARLSAQSTLAQNYFALRIADETKGLLDASVEAYTQSLTITRNRYNSGTAAKSDVVQAIAQLENTRSSAIAVGIQRAQYENAIAVLIGKSPSDFKLAPEFLVARIPEIPVDVPSRLLERRPDIAANERRMAAANAQIGLAITAFFPDISLSGSYGVSGSKTSNLFSADDSIWSFGPKISQLIFDGGLKWNQVKSARAFYDESVALYRQSVLTAMGQVENQLAALSILARQSEVEQAAVNAADEAERLVLNQYKAGTLAYTSVLTAQTTALNTKQNALTIRLNQLNASVQLIQALGGGWDRNQLETDAAPSEK
jgi:NodT family efflux transporter outer membrane factor (OMF) lipoprotein